MCNGNILLIYNYYSQWAGRGVILSLVSEFLFCLCDMVGTKGGTGLVGGGGKVTGSGGGWLNRLIKYRTPGPSI